MIKKIAPIIITILVCGYICIYAGFSFFVAGTESPTMVKGVTLIIGIGALALAGAMIYTLISRLKEIDKEDDDDLSKY